MKKIPVIILVVLGLVFSAYAEAAKPKRRSRNANRVGPYAGALLSWSSYSGDQSDAEDSLASSFDGLPTTNLTTGTKDSDIGYQAAFGYRFNRYVAAEFELVQFGELSSHASADVDLLDGNGPVPVTLRYNFHVGGPQLSALGILPVNDKFEFFAKAGVLFASSEREFTSRVDGQSGGVGSAKGDSTEVVLGVGFAWHINQMYSVRAQYERLSDVGDPDKSGTEDLNAASLGLIVRF
ncbi:MAG TPA: outer membrane beta-barrel protein [Steroidobacteraceae bacterium]|nr:outer membrane beta-barrel protein [Steroidobacteraceae bacterium]